MTTDQSIELECLGINSIGASKIRGQWRIGIARVEGGVALLESSGAGATFAEATRAAIDNVRAQIAAAMGGVVMRPEGP